MRLITANRIFNGSSFLDSNTVLVLNGQGQLTEILTSKDVDSSKVEKLDGIITPGFINAHCHLELSHLYNQIPQKKGLVDFAKHIITQRHNFTHQQIIEAALDADKQMALAGIVAVGDISNTNFSFSVKQKSAIYYHTFIELIGLKPESSQPIFAAGNELINELKNAKLPGSFSAHAPYSCSLELIKLIINYNTQHQLPFSIHNQESEEENKFLQGKPSAFKQLYDFLKLDISWFKPNFTNSLNAYANLLQGKNNILVHNTFTSESDYQIMGKLVYWCLCPSANLYIENTLPDYTLLTKHSTQLCFGTDSLASNTNLDILKEATIFYKKTNNLELTLKGLTSNGATALGIQEKYGTMIKGKNTGLNLIEEKENTLLLKKIIS